MASPAQHMDVSALDFELPPDRIATRAAEPRDSARLMVIRRAAGAVEHRVVRDLPEILAADARPTLLVFNQTKVVPAYIEGTRAGTGGRVTGLFVEEPEAGLWRVLLESGGKLTVGERIELDHDASLRLEEARGGGEWRARLVSDVPTLALLERLGKTPLPPYIRKQRRLHDEPEIQPGDAERYNTVFAAHPGSVAAPTASLHFTDELLARLDALPHIQRATLTLHVGLGTFAPVRSNTLEGHDIHSEWFHVPGETLRLLRDMRETAGRILPVGTTCVRALESLPDLTGNVTDAMHADGVATDTKLFIRPDAGFTFRYTDGLMTNFHLPRSTLLALVAALPGVGLDRLLTWYRIAIDEGYRFYSYGDASLFLD